MINSRSKGKRGELQAIGVIKDAGWKDAARTSDGRRQHGRGDVRNGPEATHLELKWRERVEIVKWFAQATDEADGSLPVVAFRTNATPWLAVLPFDELLALLRLREAS